MNLLRMVVVEKKNIAYYSDKGPKRMNIYNGKIITLKTHAVVNSCHRSLLRGCGVDGEIHRRTAMEIFKFCKKLPIFNKKKGAQILPGQIICFPNFDCRKVVVARTNQSA